MINIDVAMLHFERKAKLYEGVITTDEVLKVLNFVKQCDKKGYGLIAIGYHVYIGDSVYKDLDISQMFEGGFAISK